MITVHNLNDGNSPCKPMISSIAPDVGHSEQYSIPSPANGSTSNVNGWQAFSGKSTITMPSPTSQNESNTEVASRLSGAYLDNVNRARYFDIAVGIDADDISNVVAKTGNTDLLINSPFGNWRNANCNGIWTISSRVMLQPKDTPKVEYGIKYETSTLSDTILKKGLGSKLSKITETVNEVVNMTNAVDDNIFKGAKPILGERMSTYKDLKLAVLSKTQETTGITELSFNFTFGQAGIYSGEEEVVKPILAIANIFAIKTTNTSHSFMGPIPTENHAKAEALAAVIAAIRNNVSKNELKDLFKFDTSDENIAGAMVNTLNNVTDALYGVIDTVANAVLSSITTVVAIIGSLVLGPYICEEIKWSFDFDNVDEYGFPCSGSLTLGSLSPIKLMTDTDYARQWGYEVGVGTTHLTAQEAKQISQASEDMDQVLKVIGSSSVYNEISSVK